MYSSPLGSLLAELQVVRLRGRGTQGPCRMVALWAGWGGEYQLTTYPMLFSGQDGDPPNPTLTDSLTGAITTVRTAAQAATACDPNWM